MLGLLFRGVIFALLFCRWIGAVIVRCLVGCALLILVGIGDSVHYYQLYKV